ncbi:MAG: protein kinase [Puniceicoccaceae bacterium]
MKYFDDKKSEAFWNLGKNLSQFFDSEKGDLSTEEAEFVTPILNSLDETRYHLTDEKFIVEGGEKVLHKAYDKRSDRWVAIARPRQHDNDMEKEEFLREARLTCKLQHPNILPVYEIGLDKDDVPYFIMRLLSGKELGFIIKELNAGNPEYTERYSQHSLLLIFQRVLDAIIYSHSRGVLHLDLKPSNIMVGRFGQAILFDWGMAKVVKPTEKAGTETEVFDADVLNTVLHSGTMKGTPGFMAPEQVSPDGKVTPATDTYSLGAVLYYILTGTIPVEGSTSDDVMKNTRKGKVIHPKKRCPDRKIQSGLAAIAMKAMQLYPIDRYPTVRDMQKDLNRYLRGFVPKAESAGLVKRVNLLVRRHSRETTAILFAGIILIAVIGLSFGREKLNSAKLESARSEAVLNLEKYLEENKIVKEQYENLRTYASEASLLSNFFTYEVMYDFIVEELAKDDLDEAYRSRLMWSKALLEVANQQFNTARVTIEEAGINQFHQVYQWSKHYGELKPDDNALLSDQLYAEFLQRPSTERYKKELLVLSYDLHMARRRYADPAEHLPVAVAFLNLINDTPGWGKNLQLELHNEGYYLDLSGAPYTTYHSPRTRGGKIGNVLHPLNLEAINLSNSDVRDISGLRQLDSLKTLIILNVNIIDTSAFFWRLRSLKLEKLVLSEGMLSDRRIEWLRQEKEVIVLKKGEKWP